MHRWGMAPIAACECGTEEQTADHIITSCPIYHHPSGTCALASIDEHEGLADQQMAQQLKYLQTSTAYQ